MDVSPLEIPGKILVRGFSIPTSNNFFSIVKQLEIKYQDIINACGLDKLNELGERILFVLESGVDLYAASPDLDNSRSTCFIPVLQHVLAQLHEQHPTQLKSGAAPSVIIICESTKKGLWLRSWLEHTLELLYPLNSSAGLLNVTFVDDVHNESMLASMTQQPVDILIFTAGALQELLNHRFKSILTNALKYHRTRYIIFEELAMKDYFSEKDVIQFLSEICDKTTRQTVLHKLPPNAQLIFLGTIWHNDCIGSVRRALCHRARKSVMIFGSSLHALQYSQSIIWKVSHVDSDKAKLNMLVEICKDMLLEKRNVVVACSSSKAAMTVSKYISEIGGICNSVIAYGNSATSGVFKRNRDWLGSVSVIADNAWESSEMYKVSCLVHFDIDLTLVTDKTSFENEDLFCLERFSCMWNKMERNWTSSVEPPGLTHLLLSGKEPNFLALHKFLQTVNIPLPQSLKEIAKQRLEKQNLSRPLCTNFKCFAYCNTIDCPHRHRISQEDLDIQPDVPTYGELEFKVIQSISPNLYIAKLLNHYVFDENTGERICAKAYRTEARERILQMMDYYAIEKNRVCPLKFVIGELYSIPFNRQPVQNSPVESTMFLRAKLTAFVDEHDTCDNGIVAECAEIFCIDFGMVITILLTNLMILPQQFLEWKPLCTQVVLSNLLYKDEAREYYLDALLAAKQLTEGKVWQGKILLSLRDTVWINPMVQCEDDPVTGHKAFGCNLMVELVNGDCVTFQDNHLHMMIMMDYIRKQDPNYPTIEHEMNYLPVLVQHKRDFHKKGDLINWVELPLTKVDNDHSILTPVPFTIELWIDPWEIYGAVCDSESSGVMLQQLEEELTREMERIAENKRKIFSKYVTLLGMGSVVAVKVSQKNRWQRALIMEKSQDEKTYNNIFDVFLVDYGFMAFSLLEFEQVVPIRKVYVDALPFQAVCLQLTHIQPLHGDTDWKERDVEQFSSLVGNTKTMNVIAFATFESTCRPCNCYAAMAYRMGKGYALEEMGMELVLKECAENTSDLKRVCTVIKLITATNHFNVIDGSLESKSSEENEIKEFAVDVTDEEDDVSSETSLERWRRFFDVELNEGEYVAVAPEESAESCSDENEMDGKINENTQIIKTEIQKIMKGTFGKVCQNLSGLKVLKTENGHSELANPPQEGGAEEFYDAVTGQVDDVDECANFSELDVNEESFFSVLRHWFMRTL